MIVQIIAHTPVWVFVLLGILVAVGMSQTRARAIPVRRLLVLPFVMTALSLSAIVTVFGANGMALIGWAAGVALAFAVNHLVPRPQGVYWSDETRRFHVPGSWVPLMLMMALFMTKYVVGASRAMHPELAGNADFAIVVSLLYGFFSGTFLARALRIWRCADHALNSGARSCNVAA